MLTNIAKLVAIALLVCGCYAAHAQHADSLKADLRLLQHKLVSIHPDLYAYTSQHRMTQLFDSCYQQIHDDTDDRQFYGIVKVLLSAVRDGHLSTNARPQFAQFIHTENSYLPLLTYCTADSIFITASIGNSIPPGSLLVSINSHPAAVIREKLYSHLSADGYTTTKKDIVLNQIFYFYYYLAYGYSAGFTVKYRDASGHLKNISLSAVREQSINTLKSSQEERPLLSFSINAGQTGILRIGTFNVSELQEAKLDYPAFLEQTFRQLKQQGIRQLIIDLRGNGGGRDEYGVMLYRYLTKEKFRYYRYQEKDKKKLSAKPGLGIQQPAALHYDYPLSILIDGNTFSAAAEFCAVAYNRAQTTFYGQETGGVYEGNYSGQLIQTELPCSKVNVWIPTTKYVMDVRPPLQPGRGILPQHPIQITVEEYMRPGDKVLEEVLREASTKGPF
jgi:hypothetical protein